MKETIRMPSDNESQACAELIYMSGPSLFRYMTNLPQEEVCEFLRYFFDKPSNPFSQDNIKIEEYDGEIRGLLLCYAAKDIKELSRNMQKSFKELYKKLGFSKVFKMVRRMLINRFNPKLKKDEYLVSTLAVYESYRGQGIGKKLLEHAEVTAKLRGFNKLTISVESDNIRAREIYNKFGFIEKKEVVLPKRFNKYNLTGFIKMVKEI